jgi:hypothetical protein
MYFCVDNISTDVKWCVKTQHMSINHFLDFSSKSEKGGAVTKAILDKKLKIKVRFVGTTVGVVQLD